MGRAVDAPLLEQLLGIGFPQHLEYFLEVDHHLHPLPNQHDEAVAAFRDLTLKLSAAT